MITKELQTKLDFYEQLYFTYDAPVPMFNNKLKVYPVKVKDYYTFYSCLPCLTIDKNVKEVMNDDGVIEKVSNKEGMRKSYLRFLLDEMENKEDMAKARRLTSQLNTLLELVLQIPASVYCPECDTIKNYDEAMTGYEEFMEVSQKEEVPKFEEKIKHDLEQKNPNFLETEEGQNIYNQLVQAFTQQVVMMARHKFFEEYAYKCPRCGAKMRDIFSIKHEGKKKSLMVKNIEITPEEFEEFKALVPRQNILDYDADKYLDPDLKEELEIKQRLQNQDYTSPTLEKQMLCVSVGTGFSLKELEELTMRKLSYYLRIVDAKNMYYAELQASMSGFVKFKTPPKHWIFGDDKKNIAKELTDYDSFAKKFKPVT